jgi:thymidylate synthase
VVTYDSLDAAVIALCARVLESGEATSPRGRLTYEVRGVAFELSSPRRRYVSVPERRWSLPVAIGEFCWHAHGSDSVDFISWYIPRWRKLVPHDAKIRGSCYGHKIFANAPSDQWSGVMKLLREDPASRRAVLLLSESVTAFNLSAPDMPCATSLQFLIRKNKLHGIGVMRSNDLVLGLPYDVFLLTMLQEIAAAQLQLELGSYTHFVSSLHAYSGDIGLVERIADGQPMLFSEMSPIERVDQLPLFLASEARVREKGEFCVQEKLSGPWSEWLEILIWHALHRRGRSQEATNRIESGLVSESLIALLRNSPPPRQMAYHSSG